MKCRRHYQRLPWSKNILITIVLKRVIFQKFMECPIKILMTKLVAVRKDQMLAILS